LNFHLRSPGDGARRLLLAAIAALVLSAVVVATASATPAKHKPKHRAKPHPTSSLVVATDKGAVRGFNDGGMRSFEGIPYAAPPVGNLRWKAPQPHARWKGVRAAMDFGQNCPQIGGFFGKASTNEDCLYLNVFTPAKAHAGSKLPVMFWIHGGALITGESNDYDPSALVKQGIVVVTINYRLGLLGFLAHPALAAETGGHSGDYGLMDQQAALGWVHTNIARFGGNAANVTVFGESAGGLSTRSQLVSPLAKGLFAKAIIESGAYSETLPTEAQAEAVGQTIATKVGCSDQSAACLRNVPVDQLLNAEAATTTSQLPNIDGNVLPTDYKTAFSTGNFNHVPVMSGSNHDEWGLFVALFQDLAGHPSTAATYVSDIQTEFGVPAPVAALFASQYPVSAYGSADLALRALGTDLVFACNARTDVRNLSQFVPTYQYEFNDPNAPNVFFGGTPLTFPMGAYHASEIQYIWPTPTSTPFTSAQQQLAASMQAYWANFAKKSDPNGAGLPTWPTFSASNEQTQELVPPTPTTATTFAADHKCAFWSAVLGG
jgi:para-nitrobenzyl esterase